MGDRIHVVSLSTGAKRSRDEALADLLRIVQKEMDTDAGAKFRASRPDAFEPLERHVVAEAVESAEASSVLAATSNLCFVLMPFSERFDAVYRTLIVPVATELGLTVVRADELSAPGAIMEQIRVAIQQARLCIADLTEKNANVMFELGFAQAAGKPAVLLSQDLSNLAFDVQSQRVIKYQAAKPDEAQVHLRRALKTVLSGDRLTRAKQLFGSGHYRAAILEAFIALDVGLRRVPGKTGDETLVIDKMVPIREVLMRWEKRGDLTAKERKLLDEVIRIRNNAVHLPAEPTQTEAKKVLSAAETFLTRFDQGG